MISLVLVSHGLLAEGMKSAAEMIAGPQERFLTFSLQSEMDVNELQQALETAVTELKRDSEVLILCDVLGGNPASACTSLALQGTQVLCGVNLPMLLEILVQREYLTLHDLIPAAEKAAKEGVINFTQHLSRHN